jgi:hypothetical protein
MSAVTTSREILVVGVLACLIGAAHAVSPIDYFKKPDFELTGTVFDADIKQPIEGAYVVATYKIQRAGAEAVTSWCVKTLGMYTGKDGKYHSPVEKRDGRSPRATNAIRPGYFWTDSTFPSDDVWNRQDATSYSNRDIYLKKQDPKNPSFHFSDREEVCDHAPTREAAAAGTEFLRLSLAEDTKYGASEQGRRSVEETIHVFEGLPSESPLGTQERKPKTN